MRAPFPSQAEGIFSHTSSRVEFLSIFGLVCENRFPAQADGILTHSLKKVRFSMLFVVTENFGDNRFPAQADGILTHSLKKLRFSMFFALVERVCESPFSLTGRGNFLTHQLARRVSKHFRTGV